MLFDPKMTIYLTDETTPEMIREAASSEHVLAAKLYPAGATTNSASGVTNIWNLTRVLEAMEEYGLPLCIHGELLSDKNGEIDIFDREKYFIDKILLKLVDRFSCLKIVLEHITTLDAVQFVIDARDGIAATITPQHLLENRNAIFRGGLNPHYYCLPVLKHEEHHEALVKIATSGNPKFFLGTDSAPHAKGDKESSCGCAGCFTAMTAIEFYAEVFETAGTLNDLEAFTSHYGADFYGLPRNNDTITLARISWQIPTSIPYTQGEVLVPFRAGGFTKWKFVSNNLLV